MKKLMIAAAALTAGFAMADIVSSDIVGYAQSGLKNGGTMTAAQFVNIGDATEMDIQQLAAVGDDAADNVVIQTLDFAGRTVDSYIWNDWVDTTPCWVNDSFEKVEGVTIAPGAAVWVQGTTTSQGIQSAGKVGTSDVVVTLKNGGTLAGNPFPVAIDIQDVVAQGTDAPDNVVIQTLDYAGRTVDSYIWNDWVDTTPCWVNDSFEKVEGVTIASGEGLWVQGTTTDQTIRFPAPEL